MWGLPHRPHPRPWEWCSPGERFPGVTATTGLPAERTAGEVSGPSCGAGALPIGWVSADSPSSGPCPTASVGKCRTGWTGTRKRRESCSRDGGGGVHPKDRCADQGRADLPEIRVRRGGRPVPRGHPVPQRPLHRGL